MSNRYPVNDEFAVPPIDPGIPEDGITYTLPLRRCMLCKHFRIHFFHPTPPDLDTKKSALIRDDDILRIRCRQGRIRYADGDIKEYNSRQILRTPPKRDALCPGFDAVDEEDLVEDIQGLVEFLDN